MSSRLDRVLAVVQEMMMSSPLAMERGMDQELAAIAELLHNYYFYKTGIRDFPGINSSEAVRPLLRDMNLFTEEEQTMILRTIFYQGEDALRLQESAIQDRRNKLADIAEALAGSNIIGVPGDRRYREICKYWPDADIHQELKNSWCAAFVYHCCRQAGFRLPIRYPNGMCRFAGVGAWLEWAGLSETGFLYDDGQDGFVPQRGDIVIYDKLLSDDSHDHIGIVLGCNEEEIVVAEGNRDNKNYSSVLQRDRRCCILGYIRIDNDYAFHFSGQYQPIAT